MMTTLYDMPDTCNQCGGVNVTKPIGFASEYMPDEYETVCQTCQFEDHWCYGFFKSPGGKCDQYYFDEQGRMHINERGEK